MGFFELITGSYMKLNFDQFLTTRGTRKWRDHQPHPELNGLPVDKLARWTGVTLHTARLWKHGHRDPSPQALALIRLYSGGRVMPNTGQWRAAYFHGQHLHTGTGQRFNASQLIGYVTIWQGHKQLSRQCTHLQEMLERAERYIEELEREATPTARGRIVPIDASA